MDVISFRILHVIDNADGLFFKPGVKHPVAIATTEALRRFQLFGLWSKSQAARYAGGRDLALV